MRVIVTCGPSYEPIDEVRRITNFSTGELGATLAAALASAGYETLCLRGAAATWPERPEGAAVSPFTTNDDLADQLQTFSAGAPCAAIFHAAALADYRVAGVYAAGGAPLHGAKIPTSHGALTLRLEPAAKVLARLRDWFPDALRIGWKYELDGSPEEAIHRGARQIADNHLHACVINGRAYGPGFGLLQADGHLLPFASKTLLCHHLAGDFLKKSELLLATARGAAKVAISNRGVEQPGSSSGS